MYFGLSEDQRLLQDAVQRYLEVNSELGAIRDYLQNSDDLPDRLAAGLQELGLPLMMVCEARGGLGMGLLEACIVQQSLGFHISPVAFTARYALASIVLNAMADDVRAGELGAFMASGEVKFAMGLTEVTGGREHSGLSLSGDKLSGRASFVLEYADATHVLLPVDDKFICVAASDTGVRATPLQTIDRTRDFTMLDFDAAQAECLVEDFSPHMERLLAAGRVLMAADTMGAAEHMLQKAVAYSLEREQFGRAIGSFQAVKHMCAEMAANLEPCRSLIWYAGHSYDSVPEELALMSRLAKARLSEVGKDIARGTTEVHGGMGFTDLLGLHYWFKRIGVNRQTFGGPVTVRAEAARLQGWSRD
jgi:alkylation response protein AidB-like acyl-CoA dehydrogenase